MDEELFNKVVELDKQLIALKVAFDAHAIYTEKALTKAEQMMNVRLDGMNEFREQIKDQTSTFVTTSVYSATNRAFSDKLDVMQRMMYIGVGMLIVLQIAVQVMVKFI